MQDLGKLNSLAGAEIGALLAEGITPTPGEIIELNALGWAVQSPETRRLLSRGIPVFVGGATLWPMTLYAADWFDRVGDTLPERLRGAALAFAMAHGYSTDGALDVSGRDAQTAVKRWARKLRCTKGELETAMAQIIQQDEDFEQPPLPDELKTSGLSYGDLSAFLAAAMPGTDPAFWERRCAVGYCFDVLRSIAAQNRADDKPIAGDPRIEAERALGWAIRKIKKRAAADQSDQSEEVKA